MTEHTRQSGSKAADGTSQAGAAFDNELLERNLRALSLRSASAVRDIRAAGAAYGVTFLVSDDGLLTAKVDGGRLLASERGADLEAKRFAESVDVKASAAIVVRGFGVGHHLRHLSKRVGVMGLIVCFEPDVALLREVLGRVDCAQWLRRSPFVLVTRADEMGALAAGLEGLEGLVAAGVTLVDHPSSKVRIGAAGERFASTLTAVVKGVRTNVVTTLAHSEITLRNLLGNAGVYAHAAGIGDLKDCQKGRPAVVVSAGPSLRRNVDLLSKPGVRDRVVIIAAQTVLKQLLAKGIKPHFVTALDYHEISTRFYEGLTAKDVEGVTLVVEPKANCAILRAFPGQVRCVRDDTLARVLGKGLAREMGSLPMGATVAHLSYYLARHLGCDPVLLIGQDLGFTDGQYYSPGAAIHQVWSAEVNEFCSLEMLEWQRIMRMRAHLRKTMDQQGRAIFTDEQMATYLLQFERDFMRDKESGKTTIDATEGGVLKQHTRRLSLREAFEQLGVLGGAEGATGANVNADLGGGGLEISFSAGVGARQEVALSRTPALAVFPTAVAAQGRGAALVARLETLARECGVMREACTRTIEDLNAMLVQHGDQRSVNRLIERVQRRAGEVTALEVQWLVQHLNQTGQLNRFKADRAIELDESLSPLEKQRRQIERDIQNVTWLRESAATVAEMLGDAAVVAKTGIAPTRGVTPQSADLAEQTGVDGRRRSVWAAVWVDRERSAMGVRGGKGLAEKVAFGGARFESVLSATMTRLGRMRELDGVLLLAADEASTKELLGSEVRTGSGGDRVLSESGKPVRVVGISAGDAERVRSRLVSVGGARLWSRHSWRTGIANVSVYDELLHPAIWSDVLRGHEIDAVLLVGADWVAVDPQTSDAVVARYREAPRRHSFCITQAGVGLVGAVASSDIIAQVAGFGNSDQASGAKAILGTLGQLVGYHPLTPQPDPIAKPFCVQVSPVVRDVMVRCVWGDANFRAFAQQAEMRGAALSSAQDVAAGLAGWLASGARKVAEVVEIDVSSHGAEDAARIAARLKIAAHEVGENGQAVALTIRDESGAGPWRELAGMAKQMGFAGVHVRVSHEVLTRVGGEALIDAMDMKVDVVSVDMAGDEIETWRARAGNDGMERCWEAMQESLDERTARGVACLPRTWLVPRLTRCDATYGDIESFVDRWMLTCGACALDAPGVADAPAGSRIEALPVTANVAAYREWSRVVISAESLVTPLAAPRLLPQATT